MYNNNKKHTSNQIHTNYIHSKISKNLIRQTIHKNKNLYSIVYNQINTK